MKLLRLGLLILPALLGPSVGGCSDTTGPSHCSQPDINQPCSMGSTAVKEGTTWNVTVRSNRTTSEEYSDAGFVCSKSVTRCVQKTCVISGAPANWTAQDAIQSCQQ